MKEFESKDSLRKKQNEKERTQPKKETTKKGILFEKKRQAKRADELLVERFLGEAALSSLNDARHLDEAAEILGRKDPEILVSFAEVLLRKSKETDDHPFWTAERKQGARKIFGVLPDDVQKKALSQVRRWHARAEELAFIEEKTNAEIATILESEGYETNQGNPVSPIRIKNYFSRRRSEGEVIPKRQVSWHHRAKELSHLPPAERERILADEGYTTRDGGSVSGSAITVYLSEARAKGESLSTSESLWHERASELRSEGKSVPYIAEMLDQEGYESNRVGRITINALYIYFSRKKSEEEGSS